LWLIILSKPSCMEKGAFLFETENNLKLHIVKKIVIVYQWSKTNDSNVIFSNVQNKTNLLTYRKKCFLNMALTQRHENTSENQKLLTWGSYCYYRLPYSGWHVMIIMWWTNEILSGSTQTPVIYVYLVTDLMIQSPIHMYKVWLLS
jgi:hypothetical protein